MTPRLTDVAGHHRRCSRAIRLLQDLDSLLGGLLEVWDFSRGLILITSDHGNLEDLRIRQHTRNPVPLLVIGAPALRARLLRLPLYNLCHLAPAMQRFFNLG